MASNFSIHIFFLISHLCKHRCVFCGPRKEINSRNTLLEWHYTKAITWTESSISASQSFAAMGKSSSSSLFALLAFFCCWILSVVAVPNITSGLPDRSEAWGYVDVRPGAHLFWWLYKSPNRSGSDWPLILWLQGGPGASGVGFGNFGEVGPLTEQLLPREKTWLQKADLLFVDSPAGVGFSYVDNKSLIINSDEMATKDLVVFVEAFFCINKDMRGHPLFIIGESYGGKLTTLLGLALAKAIRKKKMTLNLGGIALGDSWISGVDYVLSWGPFLRMFSRIDENQEQVINSQAEAIKIMVEKGEFLNATSAWGFLENTVLRLSNNVDFYNVLLDANQDTTSIVGESATEAAETMAMKAKQRYLKPWMKTPAGTQMGIDSVMNGPIREKLKIIPKSVSWTLLSEDVFYAMASSFMRDAIAEVDELLQAGVKVVVYNGQLDIICATPGTQSWLQKLRWSKLKAFNSAAKNPFYCYGLAITAGFVKSYENLAFYWILKAGHMVPVDQPCAALEMIDQITRASP